MTEEDPKPESGLRNFRPLQLYPKALHNVNLKTAFLSCVSFSFPSRPLRHPDPFSYVRNAELKGQPCVWLLGHVSCPCAVHIPDPCPVAKKGTSDGCREIQFGRTAGSMTESALTFGRQRIFPGLAFGWLQAEVRPFVCMKEDPRSNASWFLNPTRPQWAVLLPSWGHHTVKQEGSRSLSHHTSPAVTPAPLWGVILFIRSLSHTVLTNLGSLHSYSCLFHTEFTAPVQPAAWSARQLLTVTVTDKKS